MEEKKSPIFSLPFHEHQMKRDLSFTVKSLGNSYLERKNIMSVVGTRCDSQKSACEDKKGSKL